VYKIPWPPLTLSFITLQAVKNKAPLPHPHAQPLRDHEPMESKSARPLNAKQSTKTTQQVRPPTISKERKLAVSRFSPHYTPPSHLKATPQTVDNRANSHKVQPVHSTETSRQVKILQRPEKGKEVKSQVSPHPSPASQHQQGASFNPTTKLAVAIPTAPAEEDAKIAEVKPSRDVSPVHQHMENSSNVKDKAQEEIRPAEMKSSSKGKDKRVKIPMKTQFKLPKNAPRGGGKGEVIWRGRTLLWTFC
jgi:glucose dehydrogenase